MDSSVICRDPLDKGEETAVLYQKGGDCTGEASRLRELPLTTTVEKSVQKKVSL